MSFTYKYPHPAVTTDCVILTFHEDKLKILLIRRGIEPYKGQWALPGGFLRMDESAEEGAYRELQEETGVTGCRIKQFHTFSAPDRDPRERVITIAFYALMKWQKATGADDAEFADWIPVDRLPPLAFDHHDIIRQAMEAIRRDIFFEPVGFDLLNDIFSMPELQKVYEAILGREFDRRNFAKKMKHLNILEEVTPKAPEMKTRMAAAPQKMCATVKKSSPLPFLDDDFGRPEIIRPDLMQSVSENNDFGNAFACNDLSIEDSLEWEDSQIVEQSEPYETKPPMKSRRKGLLFRLNKLKYNNLKNKDEMEF